jgi:hypothetical protein
MGRGKSLRSLSLIHAMREILEEIQPVTVRGVCYQLFTRGLIASMKKSETNRVSRQLTDARERGTIPWEWIVDETRRTEGVATWADPEGFARTVTAAYRRNKWAAQPARVEVWSEKGTVRGTLAPVLDAFEVPFRVMHGYASATTIADVARASLRDAKPLHVLYVGDWDPSGLHMSEEDLPARLHTYRVAECEQAGIAWWRGEAFARSAVVLTRLALTEGDVGDDLPSFDADTKRGDPRWRWFVEEYGPRCWELDALSPVVLRQRVQAAITAEIDGPAWARYVEAEALERESIAAAVGAWRGILMPAPE